MHTVIEKILERSPAEEMAKAFQLFDDDGTGKITLKNLKKIAREIDEDIDEDELSDMIKEFDLDGDGEISEVKRDLIRWHKHSHLYIFYLSNCTQIFVCNIYFHFLFSNIF